VSQLVEIRFKGNRKAYFEWHESEPLRLQEPVIVEAERGADFGFVNAVGAVAQQKCDRCQGCALNGQKERDHGDSQRRPPEPTRKVLRRAGPADRKTADDLRRGEDDVRRTVREKAGSHNLPMKISDAEWQWDRNKLTVYFTAEKRVDFRALVRELASQFRTRIELRQIGVRDEAARLGGIGRCGRELCSSSFLTELRPIGLHIAKDQRLSLNPAQISGPCGRLLCCLRFEHEFYVTSRKRFPKEGKVLTTAKGLEKVWSIDIFRDRVTLRAEDGSARIVDLAALKAEVASQGSGLGGQVSGVGGQVSVAAPPDARAPRRQGRPERTERPRSEPKAESTPAVAPGTPDTRQPTPDTSSEAAAPRRRRRRRRRRGGGGGGDSGSPPA